jgi:hypothetical protein
MQARDTGPELVNPADDFVARNDWRSWIRQLAVDNVQIGSANPAGTDPYTDFPWAWMTVRQVNPFERCAGRVQSHRLHGHPLADAVVDGG